MTEEVKEEGVPKLSDVLKHSHLSRTKKEHIDFLAKQLLKKGKMDMQNIRELEGKEGLPDGGLINALMWLILQGFVNINNNSSPDKWTYNLTEKVEL